MAGPLAALYAEPAFTPVRRLLGLHTPERPERLKHPYFSGEAPVSLLIGEVEALWDLIAAADDWAPFRNHMDRIDLARQALDLTPGPAGRG